MADLKLQSERRKLQLKANILHRRAKIAQEKDAMVKDRQELNALSGRKISSSTTRSPGDSGALRKVSLFGRR